MCTGNNDRVKTDLHYHCLSVLMIRNSVSVIMLKFITMNGICVWHMGFTLKFNYFMEYYQVFRNFLIEEACNPSRNRRERIWKRFNGMIFNGNTAL